jgi:hypothetical protein
MRSRRQILAKQPAYRFVDLVALTVDAFGVDPQEHVDRVACTAISVASTPSLSHSDMP